MRRFPYFLLALLLFIGGCARAPHEPGVLRMAQEADPSTLDPAKAYDTTSIQFARLLYRGLVEYDDQAILHPEVASAYNISPDGKTYTFTIRPDVKFTDGSRVTADSFRYAIERVLNPDTASDGSSFFGDIVGAKEWVESLQTPTPIAHPKGIEVPDDSTLIFRLNKPDATFLNYLALPFAYAVSRPYTTQLEASGKELSEHPMGSGPFTLVEWVHDGWLTLKKNPDYFRPDLPKCERIETQIGVSLELQNMLYEQGNLDVLTISDAFAPDFLRLTQTAPWKSQVLSAPMMDIRYMSMNNELEPFDDVRVRQAVNYGINRERIVSFLTGRATLAHGPLPPGMPAYNPDLKGYPFDPDRARALLKEANYKDDPKNPITLYYSSDTQWYVKAAQSIQEDLKKVGMTVAPKGLRYADLKAKAGERGEKGARLAILGWLQDFPDPANFMDPLFASKSIADKSSLNRSFYSNPRVDALLAQGLLMPPGPARLKIYEQSEAIVVKDAPMAFLHHSQRYMVHQPWVKGLQLSPAWPATYEDVSVLQ